MTNPPRSPETTLGNGGDPLIDLSAQYQAAAKALDSAKSQLDQATPHWRGPRMSGGQLDYDLIERFMAENEKLPEVAMARAAVDVAIEALDATLDRIVATPARSTIGLAVKARLAAEAPDWCVEEMLASVGRDAEALAA